MNRSEKIAALVVGLGYLYSALANGQKNSIRAALGPGLLWSLLCKESVVPDTVVAG